jgi:hypothetical protein
MNWKYFKDGVANYESRYSGFLGENIPGEFTGETKEAEIIVSVEKEFRYSERSDEWGPKTDGYYTGRLIKVYKLRKVFEVKTQEGRFWVDEEGIAVTFKN